MSKTSASRFFALSLALALFGGAKAAVWDDNYFPNTTLITDQGTEVRFFDDLIEDKIVAILFIYTSCPDVCPLETAQMVKVQNILGDRLGEDVFFYSITIDPEVDTPEVLADYKKRFGARWTHLTGDEQDIIEIRRKLGLYIEEREGHELNHNVNLIIGNQTTGRWMKRSPFENPHVLADQITNWLTGWKEASARDADYNNAPELRDVSEGEKLWRTRCASCHTLQGKDPENAIGPDLLGVTFLRDKEWLINWIRAPNEMLANEDPIAMALFQQYNELPMPNMRLRRNEVFSVLDHIERVTLAKVKVPESSDGAAAQGTRASAAAAATTSGTSASAPAVPEEPDPNLPRDSIGVMNSWIREAHPDAPVHAGYMVMVNVAQEPLEVLEITSDDYESIEVHEMAPSESGMMKMRRIENVVIPANGLMKLEPGGKHLMLKGPKRELRSGQVVDMVFKFDNGREQLVSIQVNTR